MIGNPLEIINYLYKQEQNADYKITKVRKNRSLNQNSYYHMLESKLAKKTNRIKDDVHFEMLKKFGVKYQILNIGDEIRGVQYYEKKAKIVKDNKEFYSYDIYIPSHLLNKKEFENLINGLITICNKNNIETLTPDEVNKMEYLEKSI